MRIGLQLNIKPQSYKRARHSCINGRSTTYNDKQYLAYRYDLQMLMKDQLIKQGIVLGAELNIPISMQVSFFLAPPKSMKNAPKFHVKKPDLDNLVKAVLDAGNGVLFKDDNLICGINASKHYYHYDDPYIYLILDYLEKL